MQHWRLRAGQHIGLHLRGDAEELDKKGSEKIEIYAALTGSTSFAPGTVIRLKSCKGWTCLAPYSPCYLRANMALRRMISVKLKNKIFLRLGNADCASTTGREPQRATPETPILVPIH